MTSMLRVGSCSHVPIFLDLMSHVIRGKDGPCRPVDFRGLGPYTYTTIATLESRYFNQ